MCGVAAGAASRSRVVDLMEDVPDLTGSDTIVIGGCIRMGQLHKTVRKFMEANAAILSEKRLAFFLCSGFTDNAEEMFKNNIPSYLLKFSIAHEAFGRRAPYGAAPGHG